MHTIAALLSRFALVFVLALSAAGCSDPTVGIVSGTVTVDGNPADGAISFMPVDGKKAPTGGKIVAGAFTVTAPVGNAKIEVRVPKIVGQTRIYNTKDSPIQDVMEESLPKQFNDETELTYDVPAGKSEKNFDLSTD